MKHRIPTERRAEPIFLAALIVLLCVPLGALVYRSTLQDPINYNEGWNAYYTSFVVRGQPLYYPPAALLTNNYPPLSFVIVAPLASLLNDALYAGRIVAWLAFACVTFSIVGILRRIGDDWVAALFGAGVFASYMVINYDIYVGMDDPQMLSHAFMLCGLYLCVGGRASSWTTVASALLMCCGIMTKHNAIALPLTFTVWLFFHDRAACWRFVATGVVGMIAALAFCAAHYGMDFFSSILAPRPFLPVRAWRHIVEWTAPMQIPLVMAALASAPGLRDRFSYFFTGYVLIALFVGYAASGGDATNFNLLFDAVIGFGLAAGHLVARLERAGTEVAGRLRFWAIAAYAFSALVTAGLVGSKDAFLLRPWIASQRRLEAETRETIKAIADRPGPAVCEQLALCYWAGKNLEIDPLNFAFGVEGRTKQLQPVLDRVASHQYATILIRSTGAPSFFPEKFIEAVQSSYRLDATKSQALYVTP